MYLGRIGAMVIACCLATIAAIPPELFASASAAGTTLIQAKATRQPTRVRIRALGFSGLWTKTVSVRGALAHETAEREFATFQYLGLQDKYQSQDWIVIGNVTRLYLVMNIPDAAVMDLPTRLRSDEPELSHYLFYKRGEEWVQQPVNRPLDFLAAPECIATDYSWEDGGGFLHQDFFFQIQIGSDCIG